MRKIFAFITSICVIFSCTMEDVSIPTTNDAANDIFYAAFEDYSVESRTYLDQNVKLLLREIHVGEYPFYASCYASCGW